MFLRPDLIFRLLEFAFNYFDLKTFPDGETKRALQRVINKRSGGTGKGSGETIKGSGGTSKGSGGTGKGSGETIKRSGGTHKGSEEPHKGSGDTHKGSEETNNGSGNTRDVREEDIERRNKKKRRVEINP